MFSLRIGNQKNEILDFTKDDRYAVIAISGLGPPNAIINTTAIALTDGSRFNSSRVNERNIVITIRLRYDVENARLNLYRFFKSKFPCRCYYQNSRRNVFIDGYVESVEIDLFSIQETVQVSIICPDPYFKDLTTTYTSISKIIPRFEFPFSIDSHGIEFSTSEREKKTDVINRGDVPTGIIMELKANGRILQPRIYNSDTKEMFGLKVDMQLGDLITINTLRGQKSISLLRNGVTTNIMNSIMEKSSWFQLSPGDNIFTYTCDVGEEFFDMRIIHNDLYEGV